MAGLAKTDRFQFTMATVMVGPQASLLSLNPVDHSLGLVKNLMIESNPSFVELTQGQTNDVVWSEINDMQYKCSAEVYEFTPRNIAYGLSLDASNPANYANTPAAVGLQSAVAAAATTFVVPGDKTAQFTAGTWGYLQEGTDDYVHIFKVLSSAFSTNTTVTITGYPVPASMAFSVANGRAGTFNKIDVNPNVANNVFSMAVNGTIVNSKRPVRIVFPKIKIVKGFSMKFSNDQFQNMPFEFEPMTPLPSDASYNSDFAQRMHVMWP